MSTGLEGAPNPTPGATAAGPGTDQAQSAFAPRPAKAVPADNDPPILPKNPEGPPVLPIARATVPIDLLWPIASRKSFRRSAVLVTMALTLLCAGAAQIMLNTYYTNLPLLIILLCFSVFGLGLNLVMVVCAASLNAAISLTIGTSSSGLTWLFHALSYVAAIMVMEALRPYRRPESRSRIWGAFLIAGLSAHLVRIYGPLLTISPSASRIETYFRLVAFPSLIGAVLSSLAAAAIYRWLLVPIPERSATMSKAKLGTA
jgi:hypothetical protein